MISESRDHGVDGDGPVLVRRHGHVAEIVLNRPEAMNAISTRLAAALRDVLEELGREPDLRAMVLAGAGERAFCVGADLKERHRSSEHDLMDQRTVTRSAYDAVRSLKVPTVAAVRGWVLGGGFEVALACDLIVADDTAVFGLPEVRVGVIPGGGGTQNLVRRIGYARAADLILTGRRVPASEGVELGIVSRLVDQGLARQEALSLAATIARNSPIAVRSAKRALRLGQDIPLEAAVEVEDALWRATAVSADRTEGVAAFVERREPRWSGR